MKRKADISSEVERVVAETVKRAGISRVVAGVSGGADSTALMIALKAAGIEIKAIHCNFHLRGEESMRDQEAVEALCRKYEVSLEVA